MKVIKFVRFSLKMLRCRARELSACASRPFFMIMRVRERYARRHYSKIGVVLIARARIARASPKMLFQGIYIGMINQRKRGEQGRVSSHM